MRVQDSGSEEKLQKLIESALKSTHIPTRLAAIYGSLYLLESAANSDAVKSLLNTLLEFVNKVMDTFLTKYVSNRHRILWCARYVLLDEYVEL